ncbi:MAG: cation:proton antiporter subunit C [Candidatus Bipolaricaulaceae bacterium]|nr:cation:proton antiporter subunit C [Candidatus Bipolaricaulota bacterium]MCX7844106.1 cation:proton antiporter subunit C [Candidatus Bipolaricaulota bacterium]MDW8152306.1 cation:proton antiporter subunit C [Candidatus Bipolaricaulota bacterium]
MIGNLPFVACMVLIALGLWTLVFKRNLIKLVIGIGLIESGVNLFLVALGYVRGGVPPIYTYAPAGAPMVLPTPQALTLTSIVIGLATTALMLAFAVVIYRHKGTLDARKIRDLRG